MQSSVRNLLHDRPWLYDVVFPEVEATLAPCRTAIARHRSTPPRSVLDVGCGTGRLLEALAGTIPECWGVGYLVSNVAHARARHPGLVIHQGDMRGVRLGRTFDLITSFGNVLSYALTDEDLRLTAATLAAHAAPGSLLLLDALNARASLDGGAFRERIEAEVDAPGFQARSVATHTLDRAARRLTRTRVWHIAGQPDVQDHAEYRLLDPEELTAVLEGAGLASVRRLARVMARRRTTARR